MNFGQNLKEARKKRNLTQAELGKISGLPTSSIAQYETDVRRPDINSLYKICTTLNVPADTLLGLGNSHVVVENKLSKLSLHDFSIVTSMIDFMMEKTD
jgi:transcriptional regulator with XRE-family HTH domain